MVLSTYIRQPTTITPSPEDSVLSFDHHKKPHICAPIDTYIHTKRCVHIHIYIHNTSLKMKSDSGKCDPLASKDKKKTFIVEVHGVSMDDA